jgi:folate-dependent phosphoribosylglycinamide formyltransferase PurN
MYRIGWFSTGRGDSSRAMLRAVQDTIAAGRLDARIEFVFCSREYGETEATDGFLRMVEGYGIPLVTFSYQKYRRARGMKRPSPNGPMPQWRLDYDARVMQRIARYQPDLCLLAGFLLIFGPAMANRYNIINLHPALPGGPVGMWQQVIWELIDKRADETGAMMHLAIPELDKGAAVSYCKFPVGGGEYDAAWREIGERTATEIQAAEGEDNALFKLIRQAGVVREAPLIVATIDAFSQGRVRIDGTEDTRRIVDAAGRQIDGYDLSREIDELLDKARQTEEA